VLKATLVNLEVRKPAGKWEKVAGESYAHVVQGSDDEPPRGLIPALPEGDSMRGSPTRG
jgi:hypothetical protein